ncbi:hypothetical protein Tco_0591485 [Tanacetum coccineum]
MGKKCLPKALSKRIYFLLGGGCLGGKTRGFDQITNKDAIILYCLANGVNIDYAMIFCEDIINKLKKKNREKVVPYTIFLSLLLIQKMKDGYGDGDVTIHPTQSFKKPVAFKAPRTSSQTKKKVSQGTKPGVKVGHKKKSSSSTQPPKSNSKATKGGSSKAPIGSKTSPFRKRKESSSAKDSNPSQPPVFTPLDTGMHKEDQQAAGGPTSLGVTSEEGAHPQLSSGMSAFSKLKAIYSASVIIRFESASGYDASTNSTAEADPGTFAPNDSLPPQQGKDEGTKNYSLDHIFTGTDPNVLADKTKSVSDGLETVLATTETGTKNVVKPSEEIKCGEIKLEDLVKLVPNVKADFKDLDSPEDDPIIVVDDSEDDEDEDKNEEIISTMNDKTKDILAFIPLTPSLRLGYTATSRFTLFITLTTTVTSLLSQITELKSLQWELPTEFLSVPNQVASVQAKLKTLDALLSLLLKVTQALNMFAKVLYSASKDGDQRVPSASQASTMPAEGEKNTNQATISQLF